MIDIIVFWYQKVNLSFFHTSLLLLFQSWLAIWNMNMELCRYPPSNQINHHYKERRKHRRYKKQTNPHPNGDEY